MIKFGPSGTPEEFAADTRFKGTEDMPAYLVEKGLDCFEYSFGRGVRMTEATARRIGQVFADHGIEISVHAPYFVNLASPDPQKIQNSFAYILDSLQALRWLGGKRCVFHPGSPVGRSREEAMAAMLTNTQQLVELIYRHGFDDMLVCPETMGKVNQMGTVEEVAKLCALDPVLVPCVDFGHVNARERGSLKGEDDYRALLDELDRYLPWHKIENMHVHFSKVMYTQMGEKCHLTFADTQYGPEFAPLARVAVACGLQPYMVCESAGTQGIDAVCMRDLYRDALLRK